MKLLTKSILEASVNRLVLLLFALLLLPGCYVSPDDHARLQRENAELSRERDSLKNELNEIKFGPSRLLAEAKKGIEEKTWSYSAEKLKELIKIHPAASESEEAKVMLSSVEKNLQEEKERLEKEALDKAEAEKKRVELEEQKKKDKIDSAVKSMSKNTDEIKGITWYWDKSTSRGNTKSCIYCYFGKEKESIIGPRLYIQYGAESWLFVKNFMFKADDETFEIFPDEVKRDNGYGGIWEWVDMYVDDDTYSKIKKIVAAKKVTIRYVGNDYRSDREIPTSERKALGRVLDAMNALKGS